MLYLDALKFEPVANIIHTYIYHRKLVLLGDSLNLRNLLLEKYQLQPEYIATSVESNLKKVKNIVCYLISQTNQMNIIYVFRFFNITRT